MTLFDIVYMVTGAICGWEYAKYEKVNYIVSIEGMMKFIFVGIWIMLILVPFKMLMNIFFGVSPW